MYFTGKSELSIDEKRRLAIPAKIRGGLDPKTQGEAFYAVRGPNEAIWLWPERTFERMAGAIDPSFAPAPELQKFDELTFPEAEKLDLDSAGRVRLPEEMVARAGLTSPVLLLGMRDHLEIWDPERWAARSSEHQARREEIIEAVRRVMPNRRAESE